MQYILPTYAHARFEISRSTWKVDHNYPEIRWPRGHVCIATYTRQHIGEWAARREEAGAILRSAIGRTVGVNHQMRKGPKQRALSAWDA
jgi:hypothetical protein